MEAYANNKSIARDSFKLMLAGRFIKAGTTLGEVRLFSSLFCFCARGSFHIFLFFSFSTV